jgi:hypothetical protein
MKPEEKRRALRQRHDSVLEIYDEEGHFITGTGRLVNFSKVGVCISSTQALACGERLRARLRLLKEGTLDVSAKVVWIRKKPNANLYGLAFESVAQIHP